MELKIEDILKCTNGDLIIGDKLKECKEKYVEFFTEEKAMSYINNKGLDSYYTDFYKQEFVGDIENIGDSKIIEDSINEVIEVLNTSEEIINFLVENKNSWNIDGDNIVFSSESLHESIIKGHHIEVVPFCLSDLSRIYIIRIFF